MYDSFLKGSFEDVLTVTGAGDQLSADHLRVLAAFPPVLSGAADKPSFALLSTCTEAED